MDVHHRSGEKDSGWSSISKDTMPAPEPAQRHAFPPAADVTALLRDPRYSTAFDKKYGKGVAAKILGGGATMASSAP